MLYLYLSVRWVPWSFVLSNPDTTRTTCAQSGSGAGSSRPHRPGTQVYPLRMAPSPRRPPPTPKSATSADIPDDTTDSKTEIWNTAVANLPAFLVSLDRNDSLLSSVPGLLTLWTRGYEIDGKGRKVVESDKHMLWVLNNPDTEYTFEDPSPVGRHKVADAARSVSHFPVFEW